MADLNTAQKAPLLVTTAAGVVVRAGNQTNTIAGTAIRIVNENGADGTNFIVADEPGTATITTSYSGQTGSLVVTVTAAPLVLTMGAPVAK